MGSQTNKDWAATLRSWLHPRVITMLFLGFSAGIPILLIFSTLSAWLTEAGVKKSAVTFFSWAALGYSFKFVWAPLIDRMPLPYLTRRLGRRRAWMVVSQLCVMGAIFLMALVDPAASQSHLTTMAWAAVLLGFSSATQDIVIDAYRIECAERELQAMLSATYIAGYRIGMLVAGAGSLALAAHLGTTVDTYSYTAWRITYFGVGFCMIVGLVTALVVPEPIRGAGVQKTEYSTQEYLRFFALFLGAASVFVLVFFYSGALMAPIKQWLGELLGPLARIAGFLVEAARLFISLGAGLIGARTLVALGLVNREMLNDTYIEPVKDFFTRYGMKLAVLLLLLIGFYRISDIVLGVISTVFYLEIGFSKTQIASIVKTFGLLDDHCRRLSGRHADGALRCVEDSLSRRRAGRSDQYPVHAAGLGRAQPADAQGRGGGGQPGGRTGIGRLCRLSVEPDLDFLYRSPICGVLLADVVDSKADRRLLRLHCHLDRLLQFLFVDHADGNSGAFSYLAGQRCKVVVK